MTGRIFRGDETMDRQTNGKSTRLTVILIATVVELAAAAFLLSRTVPLKTLSGTGLLNLLNEENAVTGEEADAYVLCRIADDGVTGVLPLPEDGEISFPIRQKLTDGTESENVLHLLPDGFYMESATCRNQNCVEQGPVPLKNREIRVMQNCVICLPNRVTAELYTAEEIQRMIRENGKLSE